jgi:hypothetical protein
LYSLRDTENNVLIMKVRANEAEVLTMKHDAIRTGRMNSLMVKSILHTSKFNTHELI